MEFSDSGKKFKEVIKFLFDSYKDLINIKGTNYLLTLLTVDGLFIDFDEFYGKYKSIIIDSSKDKKNLRINDKLLDLLAFVL